MQQKIDELVDRFLSWPLPESVCSDQCATIPGYPHRVGTNLLTAKEAKQMIEHVLDGTQVNRPKIVCLCGSSRFYKEYQQAEYEETMKGNIYLSIGFYPHSAGQAHGEGVGCTSEQKIALDELHKRKIDLADEVYVLDVGGYIGDSTRSEIDYAIKAGKPVRYLSMGD